MKTQSFKCTCGSYIYKDYGEAIIFISPNGDDFYLFRCSDCGQEYLEKKKVAISLDESERFVEKRAEWARREEDKIGADYK